MMTYVSVTTNHLDQDELKGGDFGLILGSEAEPMSEITNSDTNYITIAN